MYPIRPMGRSSVYRTTTQQSKTGEDPIFPNAATFACECSTPHVFTFVFYVLVIYGFFLCANSSGSFELEYEPNDAAVGASVSHAATSKNQLCINLPYYAFCSMRQEEARRGRMRDW